MVGSNDCLRCKWLKQMTIRFLWYGRLPDGSRALWLWWQALRKGIAPLCVAAAAMRKNQ
jgi:hypothetical protein